MIFGKHRKSGVKKEDDDKTLIMDLQWGGYYATKNNGKFTVFRLLDFNKEAFHYAAYREHFDHQPSIDEVTAIKPFIHHIPHAIGGLFHEQPILIGYRVLTADDLQGYVMYLREARGVDETRIHELLDKLIEFSKEKPVKVEVNISALKDGAFQ